MKKIEDYLHLYLPFPFMWVNDAVPFNKGQIGTLEVQDVKYWDENKKPILRPLSDMTEEEAKECWQTSMELEGDSDYVEYYSRQENYYQPLEFLYLLSKHFDLFNLIPEGLAIDSTTIKK